MQHNKHTQKEEFSPPITCIAYIYVDFIICQLKYVLYFFTLFFSVVETFCERSTNVWKRLFQDSKRAIASKRNGEFFFWFFFFFNDRHYLNILIEVWIRFCPLNLPLQTVTNWHNIDMQKHVNIRSHVIDLVGFID